MTTLSAAAFNLYNVLMGGHGHNNAPYSIEQIKYTIRYYRALLIRRDLESNTRTSELEQDLGLLPMQVVDPSDGALGRINGLVLRSTHPIPGTVRLKNRDGLCAVTSPDFRYTFPIIDYHMARWQTYKKYTGGLARAFSFNDYIYLTTDTLLREIQEVLAGEINASDIPASSFQNYMGFVRVRGIFEDPKLAWEFANPNYEFDDDSTPYPLPGDMEQRIVQSILNGEFKVLLGAPHDTIPNLQEDSKLTS